MPATATATASVSAASASSAPSVTPTRKSSAVPEKKYKCQFCNRAFSRSEHRSRHERSRKSLIYISFPSMWGWPSIAGLFFDLVETQPTILPFPPFPSFPSFHISPLPISLFNRSCCQNPSANPNPLFREYRHERTTVQMRKMSKYLRAPRSAPSTRSHRTRQRRRDSAAQRSQASPGRQIIAQGWPCQTIHRAGHGHFGTNRSKQ